MQGEFLLDLLRRLQGVHTIIETTGNCDRKIFQEAVRLVSRLHYGIKIINDAKARYWTGCGTERILENLHFLDEMTETLKYIFRIPLIDGAVTTPENLHDLMTLCHRLKHLKEIEFLSSNALAPAKYRQCRREMAPECANCRCGPLPAWFDPWVPWKILK